MAAFTIILSFIAIIAAIVYYKFRTKLDLPGPKGLPIIGNVLQFDKKLPFMMNTIKWAKLYGPVYRIRFFHNDIVIIGGYKELYEALVKRGRDFSGRPQTYRFKLVSRNSGIPFKTPDEAWDRLRKAAQKQIRGYGRGLETLEEILADIGLEMMDLFRRYEGKPVNPRGDIQDMALRIILIFVFRKTFDKNHPIIALFKERAGLSAIGLSPSVQGFILDVFHWLRYFGNKTYKTVIRIREIEDEIWRTMLPGVRAQMAEGSLNGIAHAFVKLYDEDRSAAAQRDVIVSQNDVQTSAVTLIVAGIGTTTNSMYALMNILIHKSDVQDKIQTEVDTVMAKSNGVLSMKCKHEMPYKRAVIFELLRYTSIAPFAIPDETTFNTEAGGYTIPKGTIVLMDLWSSNHDDSFWRDPYDFRPERFLDEEGKLVLPDHPNRQRVLAFGAGTRVCLGETLALTRLFLWTAKLTKNFTLCLPRWDRHRNTTRGRINLELRSRLGMLN